MDQSSLKNVGGDSRQQSLSDLLGRKMGGGPATSGSATASPSSSASSSSSSTPKTFSQRTLQTSSSGNSSALNALNELLQKHQPASKPTDADTPNGAPKPTTRRKRAENPALQALLAQRNGSSPAETSTNAAKSSASGESRNRAIAELLAKRAPQPTESSYGDERKHALADMLSKRGGSKEVETRPRHNAVADMLAKRQSPPAPTEKETTDPKANVLAAMLAKRNGGGEKAAKKNNNAVADMLAKRAPPAPKPTTEDPRSNALAEMLSKRGGSQSTETAAPTPKPKADKPNPLAEMLAKRQAPAAPSPSSNPLAAMLAKRQAPAAASNPLAEMMAKRQAANAAPVDDKPTVTATPAAQESSEPADSDANTPLKDHPKYGSYFKMLKIGLAPDVVKHRMRRENVDPSILDCDPNKPLPKQSPGGAANDDQDPEFLAALKMYNTKLPKYQQMLKMGLPRGAVEQKMRMEGVDVAWLDGPPQPKKKVAPTGPTEAEIAAHRQKYAQYFQMLKMGLPRGAVEHKMKMAGVDPRELDGPFVGGAQSASSSQSAAPRPPLVKKANAIRKKIHWEVKRQEAKNSRRDSLWNLTLDEDSSLSQVRMSKESKEMLEKLFVKEVNTKPAAAATGSTDGKKAPKQAKKQVMYLIDMKKSQNIAITLARIKLTFPEMKREILALNPTVLSTAQLQSLMDMWPDQQEQVAIDNFHGDDSLIGAAEKFLVEVRNIPRFREKLGCLVFKQEFPTRVHELRESINLVIRGVNQVCCSSALQQLFIYILQTGNLLNFGTDEIQPNNVGGFSLNSLVKLSQTKAFTGGVTFLQYVVQSIERDIPQLARFPQQINLIQKCCKVSISSLFSEKRALEDGLKSLNHEAQAVVPAEGDADAELGASILKHFAAEVERELDALQDLLDRLMESKGRFLEYFEEEETSEELDVLLSHIAGFTAEFQREHDKHLEALEKKRLQEQQRLEQEAKKKEMEKRKQLAKAPRHSLHENPLHRGPHNHHSNQHGHGHSRRHSVQVRHTLGAKPEEPNVEQEDLKPQGGPSSGQRDFFPQFVVDQLKMKPSLGERSNSSRSLDTTTVAA